MGAGIPWLNGHITLLQKSVLKKPSTTLRELENSGLTQDLTLQTLSPEQRGYRVFIHGQAWLSGFAGLQGLDDCKEQDKGEWDKLQFLVLWVPTFWDLCDPDFARSKLSYRGRRSKRLCKISIFPLQGWGDFLSERLRMLPPNKYQSGKQKDAPSFQV